jgi:lipoprotein-releasing system ATP-binding protein
MSDSGKVPALEARGVTRHYRSGGGELQVLRGVDMVVQPGEWVSVVGASGTGKSTLLRILGTLEEPTAGLVLLEGRQTSGQSEASLARLRRQRVGFVFQFHNLLGEFTALENVMMPALLAGVPAREARLKAEPLLRAVGLSDRASHRPGELSGGEQQRVAVARALVNEPGVVLADEPTGNLDPARAGEVEDLLAALTRDRGAALVVATHNPDTARKAKRILQLDGGLVQPAESLYGESGAPGDRY